MHIIVNFDIKRYKTALSKSYIDVTCTARSAESDSTDANIFMIQKLPKNALNQSTSRFSHVADPVDMQDYPAHQDQDSAYFRTSQITLRVRSQFQVQHIVDVMRKEVSALVQAMSAVPSEHQFFSQSFGH